MWKFALFTMKQENQSEEQKMITEEVNKIKHVPQEHDLLQQQTSHQHEQGADSTQLVFKDQKEVRTEVKENTTLNQLKYF